mgnify:CR=1 FL=1
MSASAQPLPNEPVLLRQDDASISRLTLNRPGQFNALSEALLAALQETLEAIKNISTGMLEIIYCDAETHHVSLT